MTQVPRRGSRPTRFTRTCRRWPRRRSRFRRKRSPLHQRPARQRLLLPRRPQPRKRHPPRPTIPGRRDSSRRHRNELNEADRSQSEERPKKQRTAHSGRQSSRQLQWPQTRCATDLVHCPAICPETANAGLWEQALIIGECATVLGCVQAERIALIEQLLGGTTARISNAEGAKTAELE